VRRLKAIDRRTIVQADRVDDELIAFVMADGVAVPGLRQDKREEGKKPKHEGHQEGTKITKGLKGAHRAMRAMAGADLRSRRGQALPASGRAIACRENAPHPARHRAWRAMAGADLPTRGR
jgi:hypothetical protein